MCLNASFSCFVMSMSSFLMAASLDDGIYHSRFVTPPIKTNNAKIKKTSQQNPTWANYIKVSISLFNTKIL